MARQSRPGTVITFYSYKGGTGRTMALANVGCLLAQRGEGDVLLIDFDLEAPGLHSFFRGWLGSPTPLDDQAANAHPGLIEFLLELRARIGDGRPQSEDDARAVVEDIELQPYLMPTAIPGLHLLKAGSFEREYAERINSFDWDGLYRRSPWLMRALAEHLAERFAYVLVDSRTGFTDSSGVCTMLLPEKLVVVFTPGRQSLFGVGDLIERATEYRRESDDLRPLVVFPLPSRIDITEEEFQRLWRYGDPTAGLEGYQPQFERLLRDVYALDDCFLGRYFDDVQLQHVSTYAYGEQIAVLSDTGHRLSLSQSYKTVTQHLVTLQGPWELEEAYRPLARLEDPDEIFTGRDREMSLFEELLDGRRSEQVVVFTDRPGSGKSALLRRFAALCRSRHPTPVPVSLVALAQLPPDEPLELLWAICRDLAPAGVVFERFEAVERERTAPATALLGESQERWGSKRRSEQAFFADLRFASTTAGPVAILLDDIDWAVAELGRLIERLLLAVGKEWQGLILVLAGERVPPGLDGLERAVFVNGLSPWDAEALTNYVKQAVGRNLEPVDLTLLDRLLKRNVPVGQIITTIGSLSEELT